MSIVYDIEKKKSVNLLIKIYDILEKFFYNKLIYLPIWNYYVFVKVNICITNFYKLYIFDEGVLVSDGHGYVKYKSITHDFMNEKQYIHIHLLTYQSFYKREIIYLS